MGSTTYQENDIRAALRDLGDGRELVCQAAVERLVELGPDVLPHLFRALHGRAGRARRAGAARVFAAFGDAAVPSLAEALSGPSSDAREAASLALLQIGTPGAREALSDYVSPSGAGHHVLARAAARTALLPFTTVVGFGAVILGFVFAFNDDPMVAGICHAVGAVALFGGAMLAARIDESATASVERALKACADAGTLDGLAGWIASRDIGPRRAAQEAFDRCLEGLDETKAAGLTPEARKALREVLAGSDPARCKSVLAVAPLIADAQMLDAVERLANGSGRCGRRPEIRKMAADALPSVRANAAPTPPPAQAKAAPSVAPVAAEPCVEEVRVRPGNS